MSNVEIFGFSFSVPLCSSVKKLNNARLILVASLKFFCGYRCNLQSELHLFRLELESLKDLLIWTVMVALGIGNTNYMMDLELKSGPDAR